MRRSPAGDRRDDQERRRQGYGPNPDAPWRGRPGPLVGSLATLVALTVLTAVLIEQPFGFATYLVSLGSVAVVWLVMVLLVGRRDGGGR